MRSLNESMAELRNGVPDFYMYQYDGHNTIGDGGRDMYDDGNAVGWSVPDVRVGRSRLRCKVIRSVEFTEC